MAEFDQYKHDYEAIIDRSIRLAGKPHDFYTKVKADYFLELLRDQFGAGSRPKVLDIGCGHGAVHPYLKENTGPITGIDVAGEVLEIANRENPDVAYLPFDGSRIPFESGSFDSALMICVMHHVPPPQWRSLLAETKRVLSPKGSLTVFEHNPFNPMTQLVVRSNVIDKDAVLLRCGQLKSMMTDVGFSQVESGYILLTPFEHRWAHRVERAMKDVPLGAQYFVTGRTA